MNWLNKLFKNLVFYDIICELKMKNNEEFSESVIQLSNNAIFKVYHNLPEIKGLSLDDALQNWLVRTNKFTAGSLCAYIRKKNTEYKIYTENEWKDLIKRKIGN